MKGKKMKKQSNYLKLGAKSKIPLKAKSRDSSINNDEENRLSLSMKKITEDAGQSRKDQRKLKQEIINQPSNAKLSFNDVVRNANRQNEIYENKKKWEEEQKSKFTDQSAKAYYKEFKKVVEAADVILQVLDARDPQGTRCLSMEDLVRTYRDKRLVLILNKADLVPRENLEQWLKYLKKFCPTLLFKASTQNQSKNIAQISKRALTQNNVYNTSKCVGADSLLQLLKNYSRNNGMKTAIVVGVVGMPNVGKSSLINSLKRSKACNVGATPGITKSLQEIILDSKVRLLDSPGVILPGATSSDGASSLRNAFKIEDLSDPVAPVEAILNKAGFENLRKHYNLDNFSDVDEFLAKYAEHRNIILKRGIPNIDAAARCILRDWNVGKITYFTLPPENEFQGQSTLVSSLNDEFNVDDLDNEMKDLDAIREDTEREAMDEKDSMQSTDLLPGNLKVTFVDDDKMEDDDEEPEKKPRWETEKPEINYANLNLKKYQQKLQKKQRKERNRNEKRTDDILDAFENL